MNIKSFLLGLYVGQAGMMGIFAELTDNALRWYDGIALGLLGPIFLPFFLLVGCSTPQKDWTDEIRTLQWQAIHLSYEQKMERCFVDYEICVLKNGTDCWKTHEACVINTNNYYKELFKKKGF